MIARSRQHITKFYREFITKEGNFPERKKPQNECPHTDLHKELSYEKLHERIGAIKFFIYHPSAYIVDKEVSNRLAKEKEKLNFNQQDREKFLIAMMHINFLKRLESSAHACTLTLERTLNKIDNQIEKIKSYSNAEIRADEAIDDLEEDEDFFINRKATHPYHLKDLDVEKWRADIETDRSTLLSVLAEVRKITPTRDGKLDLLKKQIRKKVKQNNRKLLVFTAFKDTAEYLYEELQELACECSINIALVAGDTSRWNLPNTSNFEDILDHFSPLARKHQFANSEHIDLLIATDCISEGQNLQDCDTVLNYDIHWNPVRLIQRFGRIDRLGSQNPSIQMINYWPTRDMDFYLKLESRVRARMALADVAATGDDDTLNDESELEAAAHGDIKFRDQQLKQIREEVIDLDSDDSIGLSDFTLDYFITQLLRYLEKNRKQLEAAPPGIYAVADGNGGKHKDGVIFFFRQRNAGKNTVRNPKHPFYFVHLEDGKVSHGYMHLHAILQTFE